MVRKPTQILLVVFVLMLGLLFYLQKNPLPSKASQTPSPTPRAQVLKDVTQGDISAITLKEKGSAETIEVKNSGQNEWVLGPDGKEKADVGKVEQIRAELGALLVVNEMPEEIDDNALGLKEPTYILTVQTVNNQKFELQIGDKTPIETGYYAQVDDGTAFVVSNTPIDTVVSLLKEIKAPEQTLTPVQ